MEDAETEVVIPEVIPVNLASDLADEIEDTANPPVIVERRYATRNVRGIVNNMSVIDTISQEERK